MTPKGEHIFSESTKARYGEERQTRSLFLPNLLQQESSKKILWAQVEDAYEIICKWANIESSGKLNKMNETAIEGEFCKEVFGDALGYTFFADHEDRWNFQLKFSVNGGQADAVIGTFGANLKPQVRAVIELKGPTANVDKDRSAGRTPDTFPFLKMINRTARRIKAIIDEMGNWGVVLLLIVSKIKKNTIVYGMETG